MNDERFRQLVSFWLDGSLTEGDSTELQTELERSTYRRNQFVDLCGLDADLRLMSELHTSEIPVQEPSAKSAAAGWFGPSGGTRWALAAIAATLLIALGFGIGRGRSPQLPTETTVTTDPGEAKEDIENGCAVLTRIVDARFTEGVHYREGDSLPPGKLKLLSGGLQIDFFSGATMLIEDAAEVDLVSAWEAHCVDGKVTMHVPPPAIGFRLLVPGMEVVDLGTEFGVDVQGDASALHVFDGEVEAHLASSPVKIIREGESLQTSKDHPPVAGKAAPTDFPSAMQFEQRMDTFYKDLSARWWDSMQSVRSDERILGCYLFKHWQDKRWDRLVNNFSIPKHPGLAGSAVGTRWVEGRWPTKDAMEFKSPGDRVRINLGDGKYDGLTMAAWIRVDGLDRKYNALLLADGYEDGEPHWQIDEQGRMMFSVRYMKDPTQDGTLPTGDRQNQMYRSPPVFGAGGRRWHHVAVSFDATTGEGVQYFDGEEVSRSTSKFHRSGRKVTFGRCEIGNWGLPAEGVPFPVRNLNGRVDEFLIFKEPLSGEEIKNLYELGVPK
ncbi:hypothetical protein GC197_02330 [bacterium]|nr:hypothetical protein [bacterium]